MRPTLVRPAVCLGWLLLFPAGALAQIATPSLLPDTYVTRNPAAMQWGLHSRAGLTRSDTDISYTALDIDERETAHAAGARGNWRYVSLAAERRDARENFRYSGSNHTDSTLAIALGIGAWLALGGLREEADFVDRRSSFEYETESTLRVYGASVRIGEYVFLGYAQGEEEWEQSIRSDQVVVARLPISDTRDMRIYGIGVRGGSALTWRLEVSRGEFDPFTTGIFLGGTGEVNELEQTTLVLEGGFGAWLIGVGQSDQRVRTEELGIGTRDTTISTAAVAWAEPGLPGIVYRHTKSRTDESGVGEIEESAAHTVSLVYRFP